MDTAAPPFKSFDQLPAWFQERIDPHGPLYEGAPCWLWRKTNGKGYGVCTRYYNGRQHTTSAHKAVYEECGGLVPTGWDVAHRCPRRDCCNPLHVRPLPHAANCQEGLVGHNNGHVGQTHCKRGHPFNDENTYYYRPNKRTCRVCAREGRRKARRGRQRGTAF